MLDFVDYLCLLGSFGFVGVKACKGGGVGVLASLRASLIVRGNFLYIF